MSPFDGKLVIAETDKSGDPDCSGTFYLIVTAYDKEFKCQSVSYET